MSIVFLIELAVAALGGGILGSLLGLGGGIIIVPVYTLALGLPVHIAVGTSLVAVVANAASAATVYLGSRLTNLRLALVLGTTTAAGSLVGGLIGTSLAGPWLTGSFGVMLVAAAILMLVRPESPGKGAGASGEEPPGDVALEGSYRDPATGGEVSYRPRGVRTGLAFSFLAGNLSGLLGIGGGIVQVPVMSLLLGVPMKASTATSSHIISLTAMAGAMVYLARGFVDPVVTAVTILGVYLGARAGARLAAVLPGRTIKQVFSVVLVYMAARMLARAFNLPFLG